ncbi:TetR/AcrR family transcriptional regulator [Deinococcus sp. QL22]|uniref:TetR/AcrR family transcriptional regulator n=1 Tax=Deinococcus sp. QL22 TaxID=2939437 RepID=UPI00201709D3|nr:TetR/AcrR family transcriptional regulator [Deinococcus sp. QL22]UQN08489.1 TetR/AcrR family transcriptional regulator [Deinococcus sp. QL22]
MKARRAARADTKERFLDAAERLLIQVGYAPITTRMLAEEAGANHGLVHYYFGSMEELFLKVLERFTERLVERQRAMYAAPTPFIEKWRQAMRYLDEDQPYQKVWWELQAMAWNHPEYQARVLQVHRAWRDAMRSAVLEAFSRYRLSTGPFSVEDWITLIVSMNTGLIHQRLSGTRDGHEALLAAIERWLSALEVEALEKEEVTGQG